MKTRNRIAVLVAVVAVSAGAAYAESHEGSATAAEVKQTILDSYAYLNENLKDQPDAYSKHGALEFWSSGGLMQEVPAGGGFPGEFEVFNIKAKHIKVITLVEGQAAVAHFYSEGSMQPKGYPAVTHYLTRASQVFVKEDGKWKVRSSHWSPVIGGAGTSQTAATE